MILATYNCEMETEPRKSKLRKRHEFGHSGSLNGVGGATFCASNLKSLHGIPFSRDEFQQMPLLADSQFPSASPQGPDPSAGGFGAGSGKRSGGRGGPGCSGGYLGVADVPNGPKWSHLTAAQYSSAPTGVSDDFGVIFADEVAIPAIVELEPREDEVL